MRQAGRRRGEDDAKAAVERGGGWWFPPARDAEVTDIYEYEQIPQDDPFPRFRVVHGPRHPQQTDKHYAYSRKDAEYYYRALGIWLGLSWRAATFLRLHKTCAFGICRRHNRCEGRKHEYDWSFPGPWMPPCAKGETIETIRALVRSLSPEADEADKALARRLVAEKDRRAVPGWR